MTILLETRRLTRRFGGVLAVDAVDFSLREGEVRCLIGPNGAGKSTFFKMISGQLRPTSGEVLLDGINVTGMAPHLVARRGIGIKTQVPNVFDGLTVHEHMRLAARRHLKSTVATRVIDEFMETYNLSELSSRQVGVLSHGQRQWVELAMVLAGEPRLVLMDEPTAGMTHEETRRTAALIDRIGAGRTLIVVDHDMQFIHMIAKAVTVFHQGRVLAEGGVEEIIRNKVVQDVYLGRAAHARS
jgi:branched-chain amino acid transport system ATP-binding protein